MKNAIGNNIKKYRKLKSLTQKELAEKVSISRSFMSQIEKGISNPSDENLKKIAECLDVSVNDLKKDIDKSSLSKLLELLILGTSKQKIKWKLEQKELNSDGIYIFKCIIKNVEYTFVKILGDSTPCVPDVVGTCLIIDDGLPAYAVGINGETEEEYFELLFNIIMIGEKDDERINKSISDLKSLLDE